MDRQFNTLCSKLWLFEAKAEQDHRRAENV